jgi:hypothetical protein
MHVTNDGHETPFNPTPLSAAVGAMMLWPTHVRPDQRSISGSCVELVPTATHADPAAHDMPLREPSCTNGSIDHRLPFQRSNSTSFALDPTAIQLRGAVHATPFKTPFVVADRWTDQLEPSHRSAVAELRDQPTASHTVADGHDTPAN